MFATDLLRMQLAELRAAAAKMNECCGDQRLFVLDSGGQEWRVCVWCEKAERLERIAPTAVPGGGRRESR